MVKIMRNLLGGGLSFAAVCAIASEPSAAVKPEIDKTGKITVGSKSVFFKEGYNQIHMFLDNTEDIFGSEIFDFGHGDLGPCFFIGKKKNVDGDAVTWTSDMVAERGSTEILGKYTVSLSLREDGLVKFSARCALNKTAKLKNRYFYLKCPSPPQGYFEENGKKNEFNGKPRKFSGGSDLSMVFSPETPSRKFRIIPEVYSGAAVTPEKGIISMTALDGALDFLIDLGGETSFSRTAEYYGGTDFGRIDGLCLPEYRRSRNLIQNPSFESGMRYWGYKSYGGFSPFENSNIYSLDAQNAKFGKQSLRIRALKDSNTLPLGTFAIPVTPGKRYVLSFYAKGSLPEGLIVALDGRATVTWWLFDNKTKTQIKVNEDWTRHSVEFTPLEEFYSIYFQGLLDKKSAAKEGVIWIDGVQLEEEKMTAFAGPPFGARLESAEQGNFLRFHQSPEFRLTLVAGPGIKGSVSLDVSDFFSEKILSGKYDFATDKNGEAVIKLESLDKKILESKARGVFTVKAVVSLDGEKDPFRECFRFSVMTPLANRHKNKNIFSIAPGYAANTLCAEGADRRLSRLRDIGFGSAVYVEDEDITTEKKLVEKLKNYNFAVMGRAVINKWKERGMIQEGGMKMSNISDMVSAPEETLREYETICEVKARNRPWITDWHFAGEIEGMKPLVSDSMSLGKILAATYKGIKKGNPNAKINLGGTPWNIQESGIRDAENFIRAAECGDASVKFDSTAIHVYQEMPETPDLDAQTASYIDMLKRHGYGEKPVYWDEGMNYFEYFIPSKGMTPYFGNSGDKWYPGMLTYDMGRAERIAAAFSARTWLVALKYMKNIACLNDWSIRRYFWDYDLSVGAKMKVVNTMGRILGDADFYRDIRFAPLCRCYMFVNEKKQPVAIIWGHDTAVDKGEKAPPVFTFDFGGQKLEFWDLMETQRTFPAKGGKTDIPAGPFPLFIIGEPGTEEALAKSIAEAKNVSGDITPVTVSAVPINALTAQIKLLNTLSSSLKAAASISLNGVTEKLDLTFKPNTAETRNVNMAKDMAPLKPFNFSFSAQTPGMSPKMGEISGMFTMVKTGGKDWSGVQEIRTAEGAGVKIRADESALHLSLRVPKSFAGARPTLLLDAYVKDNSWSDFKTKTQDIYVFELSSQTNGAVTAFCHAVPCVQADSGEWTPKAGRADSKITGHVSSDTNGEELWELSIPAASVMPLKFEKGERFGFNLVIKRDELLSSFAPVKDYQDAKQPGKFKLALALTH